MKTDPYYVYYPNETRIVHAFGPHHAEELAMERWGTTPTGVMLADFA